MDTTIPVCAHGQPGFASVRVPVGTHLLFAAVGIFSGEQGGAEATFLKNTSSSFPFRAVPEMASSFFFLPGPATSPGQNYAPAADAVLGDDLTPPSTVQDEINRDRAVLEKIGATPFGVDFYESTFTAPVTVSPATVYMRVDGPPSLPWHSRGATPCGPVLALVEAIGCTAPFVDPWFDPAEDGGLGAARVRARGEVRDRLGSRDAVPGTRGGRRWRHTVPRRASPEPLAATRSSPGASALLGMLVSSGAGTPHVAAAGGGLSLNCSGRIVDVAANAPPLSLTSPQVASAFAVRGMLARVMVSVRLGPGEADGPVSVSAILRRDTVSAAGAATVSVSLRGAADFFGGRDTVSGFGNSPVIATLEPGSVPADGAVVAVVEVARSGSGVFGDGMTLEISTRQQQRGRPRGDHERRAIGPGGAWEGAWTVSPRVSRFTAGFLDTSLETRPFDLSVGIDAALVTLDVTSAEVGSRWMSIERSALDCVHNDTDADRGVLGARDGPAVTLTLAWDAHPSDPRAADPESRALVLTEDKPVWVRPRLGRLFLGVAVGTRADRVGSNGNETCALRIAVGLSPCGESDCGSPESRGACSIAAYPLAPAAAYCACHERFSGTDCAEVDQSYSLFAVGTAFLVVSNVAILPAVWAALVRGLVFPEAVTFAGVFLSSSTYHICDQTDFCFGVGFGALQFADFFCALLAISFTLLAWGGARVRSGPAGACARAAIVAVGALLLRRDVTSIASLVGVAAIPVATVAAVHARSKVRPPVAPLPAALAIVCLAGAIPAFSLSTRSNYPFLHSIFHVLIMSGSYFGIIAILDEELPVGDAWNSWGLRKGRGSTTPGGSEEPLI